MFFPQFGQASHVIAIQTTRQGGVSEKPWHSLNLGTHVSDRPEHVIENRQRLLEQGQLPDVPVWLEQVHGIDVLEVLGQDSYQTPPVADAVITRCKHVPIAIMTADCLPLLLSNKVGTVVGAVHAGWRSLCAGVIEACVQKMAVEVEDILVWLGPAIGPTAFEVGGEVRQQFLQQAGSETKQRVTSAFDLIDADNDKWLADIKLIARTRLEALGVPATNISVDSSCTYSQTDDYFSYRRDGQTGRMASLIYLS